MSSSSLTKEQELRELKISSSLKKCTFKHDYSDAKDIKELLLKTDLEEKLFLFLQSVIGVIKGCPGCLSVRLLRSTENPAQLAIIEEWESVDAHQAAAKAIPKEKMLEAKALFAKPPSGAYYRD